MHLLKNELSLMNKLLNGRLDSVSPRPCTSVMATCRQPKVASSALEQYVCGFPVSQNIYDQLIVEESHTVQTNDEMIPDDENAEEYPS